MFFKESRMYLKSKESEGVNIIDCKRELLFIRNITLKVMEKRFNDLDEEKLAHVLFLLKSDKVEHTYIKSILHKFLNWEVDIHTLFSSLQDLNIM
jgi:hypothetical protein